jgi:hypothetical protein
MGSALMSLPSTFHALGPLTLRGVSAARACEWSISRRRAVSEEKCRSVYSRSYLVDPASSHMLVSKIKPCMSKYLPK